MIRTTYIPHSCHLFRTHTIHLARLCVSSQNCLITNLNEGNEVNNMFISGIDLQCSISEKNAFYLCSVLRPIRGITTHRMALGGMDTGLKQRHLFTATPHVTTDMERY